MIFIVDQINKAIIILLSSLIFIVKNIWRFKKQQRTFHSHYYVNKHITEQSITYQYVYISRSAIT